MLGKILRLNVVFWTYLRIWSKRANLGIFQLNKNFELSALDHALLMTVRFKPQTKPDTFVNNADRHW